MRRKMLLTALFLTAGWGVLKAQNKVFLYPLTKSNKSILIQYQREIAPVIPSFYGASERGLQPSVKRPFNPNDYYQQHFGFFCKQEWVWEKKTQLPVKVRLGSYQEAQRIEGKW